MKYFLFPFLFLLISVNQARAQNQSPDDYFGYPLGSRFTTHQKMVDYLKYLAGSEKNIKLIPYGKTYEGRELLVAVVSSEENIRNLEEIRKNNLDLSKASSRVINLKKQPAILWLSYNVHGNEAGPAETAMKTVFALTGGQTRQIREWLQNTLVIIDPCLNPDGRERFVNYFSSVTGVIPNPAPESREHHEPWPGGRGNHYYFDLNRDWAWQTQIETQERQVLYHQWMPEVHVDFHEQSYNEDYYFAPAAEPVHQDITAWQRAFQITAGKNNAKYFDERHWPYFTKKNFDLLYPSYGDTYPLYNGAIGMTYEQGGIDAGLAVLTKKGDTLTLKDRIEHHYVASLATLELVSVHSEKLLKEFKKYFERSKAHPPGIYKAYIIKGDFTGKIEKLADLLTKNHIEFSFGLDKTIRGYNFETQKDSKYKIRRNDLIINLHQPAAVLANVLFEPKTFVTDSNTYDITAWALPYAFGLDAYATRESIHGKYAFMKKPSENVPVGGLKASHSWVLSGASGEVTSAVQTGAGPVKKKGALPEITLVSGPETSPQSVGEIWHFFEQELKYPVTMIGIEELKELDSSKTNVLILPDGNYPHAITGSLRNWIRRGGKIILMGDAVASVAGTGPGMFAGTNLFEIRKKEFSEAQESNAAMIKNKDGFSETIPGAVYRVSLDKSHPMAFGLGDCYYTLKTDDQIYEPLSEGNNVGLLKPGAYRAGIVGKNVRQRLDSGLLFGVQSYGNGKIVYLATDVLFRSFWENGKQLFLNAVFF